MNFIVEDNRSQESEHVKLKLDKAELKKYFNDWLPQELDYFEISTIDSENEKPSSYLTVTRIVDCRLSYVYFQKIGEPSLYAKAKIADLTLIPTPEGMVPQQFLCNDTAVHEIVEYFAETGTTISSFDWVLENEISQYWS